MKLSVCLLTRQAEDRIGRAVQSVAAGIIAPAPLIHSLITIKGNLLCNHQAPADFC